MLQIQEFTETTLASLTTRSEKHGDEDVPAVSLGLAMTVANTMLDLIDPTIRESLYKRVDGQDDFLNEGHTPVLRCNSIDRVTLPTKYEGWTLEVDDGIDETTPKTFGLCKCDKFSVEPKQGGSCVLRMRVGTSDLDAERSGMLGMKVGQLIWIKLRAPEKPADKPARPDDDDLDPENPDDDGLLFDETPDAPPLTAGDVFANTHDPAPNNTTVTVKRSRKAGKLGSDAEQAARQEKVLAADPSMS